MYFIIVADGKNGKLYHLYSYSPDASKPLVFKWVQDETMPITYTAFTDADSALYYISDKCTQIAEAENVDQVDLNSARPMKLIMKFKRC